MQGGGLIPSLVRDPREQPASGIDDAGAELGIVGEATIEQQKVGENAAADTDTIGANRLEPRSTSRSRFPLQSTSSPPGLDGARSIGSPVRAAELSASSHHDCLVAQSTTLSFPQPGVAVLKVMSHEPVLEAQSTMLSQGTGGAEESERLCDPFDPAVVDLTGGASLLGNVIVPSSIERQGIEHQGSDLADPGPNGGITSMAGVLTGPQVTCSTDPDTSGP